MARTRPWELSDDMWERAQPLLPERTPHPRGGRPPCDDRPMLGAILYVLRTGLQQTFDEVVGIDWEWQSLDGFMTKALFGRAATAELEGIGHNPTDRGKHGTKRSMLSEGHGLPLALVVPGANVPDMKLAAPTLDAVVVARPQPTGEQPQHLCLDAGYDYDLPRYAAERRHHVAHVRPCSHDRANARSTDPLKRPRRWVVERLHSWLNRSRRLLVRWEKLERTYHVFVHLACALLCFQQCDRYRTLCSASQYG
jgi:putative transposase